MAKALAAQGAQVVFVSGPADVPPPQNVEVVRVQTAREMLDAATRSLPVDVAIFAAAVADWRVASASDRKLKKSKDGLPVLEFAENPDILHHVSNLNVNRPELVIGFAAETDDVEANATAKRTRKGCDWIVANNVSPDTGIMGGHENAITLIDETGAENWPRMSKDDVSRKLVDRIASHLVAEN